MINKETKMKPNSLFHVSQLEFVCRCLERKAMAKHFFAIRNKSSRIQTTAPLYPATMTWSNRYIFFFLNQCPGCREEHYKSMKIANSSSKMQRWVQYQIKWHTGTELSTEVNAFTSAEKLIYKYHSMAQLTSDDHKSQGVPVPAPPLKATATTEEELLGTLWRREQVLTSSQQLPGPAYAPANSLLWAGRSRGVGSVQTPTVLTNQ